MKNKVVYNACFGGFGLSKEAATMLNSLKGEEVCSLQYGCLNKGVTRHDPDLVKVVETLGSERASGFCARLAIEEIEGNIYQIDEYDGNESVYTPDEHTWIVIEKENK